MKKFIVGLDKISGIYGIHHIESDSWYIGKAFNIRQRGLYHVHELNLTRHPNKKLQAAFNKYGISSFEFVVLEKLLYLPDILSRKEFDVELSTREIAHCLQHTKLYNLLVPGKGSMVPTSEIIQKFKDSHADPTVKERRSQALLKANSNPEVKQRRIEAQNRPEVVKKRYDSCRKAAESSEARLRMSNLGKKRYEDPNERLKQSKIMKKVRAKSEVKARYAMLKNDPEFKNMKRISQEKRFSNPQNRIDQAKRLLLFNQNKRKVSFADLLQELNSVRNGELRSFIELCTINGYFNMKGIKFLKESYL